MPLIVPPRGHQCVLEHVITLAIAGQTPGNPPHQVPVRFNPRHKLSPTTVIRRVPARTVLNQLHTKDYPPSAKRFSRTTESI
jgi:hypothetical protein